MRVRRALFGFSILTACYLSILLLMDSESNVLQTGQQLVQAFPIMVGATLISFGLRFARWHWLLARSGSSLGLAFGFLAYLSGFLFTATPGKVGELLRIRYLTRKGVPAQKVFSAFLFERSFDLLAVLMLAALYISKQDVFVFIAGFVLTLVFVLTYFATHPELLTRIVVYLRTLNARRLATLVRSLREGIVGCKVWLNPLDLAASVLFGLAAWTVTSMSFSYMLHSLGVDMQFTISLSIYPLAMLSGAASMLPGGLGTTEAAIVIFLTLYGVDLAIATTAAIGIRLTTLWFAIVCGLTSVLILESTRHE